MGVTHLEAQYLLGTRRNDRGSIILCSMSHGDVNGYSCASDICIVELVMNDIDPMLKIMSRVYSLSLCFNLFYSYSMMD